MAESGLLIEVRWEWDGSELVADLALDATSAVVGNSNTYSVGEQFWIGETGLYTITAVDEATDTLTFTPGATEAFEEGESVIPDAGSGPARNWVAEVVLVDSSTPIEVPLRARDLLSLPEGIYDPPWAVLVSDDYERILDLPGQKPVLDVGLIAGLPKFHQDLFVLTEPGAQTLTLTHKPVSNSEHLYWNGLYQPEEETWTRSNRDVSLTGSPFAPIAGDLVVVEYAYVEEGPARVTPVLAATSTFDLPRDTLMTSLALPAATQVGDLLIVNAVGGFDGGQVTCNDSRMTRVAHWSTDGKGIGRLWGVWVGYATTLDPLDVAMQAEYSPMGQFAKGAVLALRGADGKLRWDSNRVAVGPAYNAWTGFMPAVPGTGSGAFAAVMASMSGQLGGSWQSPAMDPYKLEVNVADSGTIAHLGWAAEKKIGATIGPPSVAATWRGVVVGFE